MHLHLSIAGLHTPHGKNRLYRMLTEKVQLVNFAEPPKNCSLCSGANYFNFISVIKNHTTRSKGQTVYQLCYWTFYNQEICLVAFIALCFSQHIITVKQQTSALLQICLAFEWEIVSQKYSISAVELLPQPRPGITQPTFLQQQLNQLSFFYLPFNPHVFPIVTLFPLVLLLCGCSPDAHVIY